MKRKRTQKFINAGRCDKNKIILSNSTTSSKDTSNSSTILAPEKSRTDAKSYPLLAQIGDLVTSTAK